jgi:hypothetical protein
MIHIYSDKAGDSSIAKCGLNEVSALWPFCSSNFMLSPVFFLCSQMVRT